MRCSSAVGQLQPQRPAQLGRLGARVIEAHASSNAPRAILDDPEAPASFGRRGGRLHEIGEIVMRVDEAAGIFGEAKRDQAEELLRVLVAHRSDGQRDR